MRQPGPGSPHRRHADNGLRTTLQIVLILIFICSLISYKLLLFVIESLMGFRLEFESKFGLDAALYPGRFQYRFAPSSSSHMYFKQKLRTTFFDLSLCFARFRLRAFFINSVLSFLFLLFLSIYFLLALIRFKIRSCQFVTSLAVFLLFTTRK